MNAAAWICLLLPLAAATAITLAGTRISRRQAGYLSTATTMGAFAAAVVAFVVMLGESPEQRAHYSTSWTWLSAGRYDFGFTILTDQLSVFMMLIVAGVGSLIVAYSVGYMEGENEERRFFAYMSLFVFSMLLLVQSGNLLLLLAGWGMVGLSSYLLIGFYQEKPVRDRGREEGVHHERGRRRDDGDRALPADPADRRAAVRRGLRRARPRAARSATVVALGLLGGAVAKSAQMPLHTWLPDAMEGPTPVSALIHAATMVIAGVYLLVRTGPLFVNAEQIANLAAVLGAVTLLVAGLIALVQTDIKRVIAYSTMSQIGYMFVGAATRCVPAGDVPPDDARVLQGAALPRCRGSSSTPSPASRTSGAWAASGARMPFTKWVFLAGSLALVGIPIFSGFFSKDEIIGAMLDRGGELGYILFACCLAGAFLTGLYTFRLYFIVFHGEKSEFAQEHLHEPHGRLEGPVSMIWPVAILGVLATFAGFIQFAPLWEPITHWLDPVAAPLIEASGQQELIASVCAVALGAAGIAVAWLYYVRKWRPVPKPWAILEEKFLFDELYDAALYRPAVAFSNALLRYVERPLIAGSIAEVSRGFRLGSFGLGRLQNGLVRSYALVLTLGIAVLAVVFISSR